MTDLSRTIIPKSDQMNSDDLISGPVTVTITKVAANEGTAEQPISIFYEGDGGKPYKPCKSMRRVMVQIWGSDGSKYPGRSMTLYRDPSVKWGGLEVGGIRISHMTDIDSQVTMALTATKSQRKPYIVKPLVMEKKPEPSDIDIYAKEFGAALKTPDAVKWWDETTERRDALNIPPERLDKMKAALDAKSKPAGDAE